MERKLHYNFIDVFKSPFEAFSAKKILVMTFFLLGSLIVYNIFTYLAFYFNDEKISTIFSVYTFFPFYKIIFSNPIAQIIFILGAIIAVLTLMLGFFAVSILEIESIRGNKFMKPEHAIKKAFGRFKQILLAEIGIASFILFIVFLFTLLGLISRIPYIGELIYAILFVIPNFIIAILTLFIILVFLISIILLPTVSAAEKKGEAFQSILETFATIIRQPFRWGGYTLLSLVSGKLSSFVYAYICYRSVQFIAWATSLSGGDNTKVLVKKSLSLLPIRTDVTAFTFQAFPGIDFGFSLTQYARYSSNSLAEYLMAFMIFIIFASIIGYFLTIIAVGQARGYAVIRYLKDGYKIEDEEPQEA